MSKSEKVTSLPLEMAAFPHNGRPEYRQTVNYVAGGKHHEVSLGGQKLLIFLAVYIYTRLIAPVGRRFGKTTAFPFLVQEESRITVGKYYAMFIAQSHDKAMEMMELCIETWGGIHHPKDNPAGMVSRKVGGPNDQRRYLEVMPFDVAGAEKINTGMRIYFVSGSHPHYKKIRGYTHHMNRVVCDEYAQIHPLLRKVVMPMLADCGGRFLAIGTTDEDEIGNTQFRKYYNRGQSSDQRYAEWGSMNFPSMANPHLSEKGVADVINDCIDDDELQQEVYAKFLQGKGSVFSNLDAVLSLKPDICNADPDAWPQWVSDAQGASIEALGHSDDTAREPTNVWIHKEPVAGHNYVMSVDWAKERDHTIIGVYDLTKMTQVALFRFHGEAYTAQLTWVKHVKEHYGADEIHGDENSGAGASMGDLLRAEYETGVIPHKFGPHNKGSYVRRGQIIFYELRMRLIDCEPQREEFRDYRKILPDADTGSKLVRYAHPSGGHDDFVDSFLHISEQVVVGSRPADVEDEPRGYNMVDENGQADASYWGDSPDDDALEDWQEEMIERAR